MDEWVNISILVRRGSLDALMCTADRFGFEVSYYEEPITNERGPDGYQLRVLVEVPVEVQFFAKAEETLPDRIEAFRKVVLAPPVHALAVEQRPWSQVETSDNWRDHHAPIDIDGRLLLCPDWIEPHAFEGVVIRTTPGGAFGSGKHGTTRDCLRALIAHLRSGESVADLGAGSGVLSIAARRLGSGPVLAVEIDRIDEIPALAQLNGLDGVTPVSGDWREVDINGISLVVANISATDASELVAWTAKLSFKPRLILSGIATWSLHPVESTIQRTGYEIRDRFSEDGEWVTLYVIPKEGN